ncbi:hypothetical protein GOODEAATRI_013706, partial [Goodea atripinnis]
RSRSWCCQVEWAKPSRPPSSSTPTSLKGTQTSSLCSIARFPCVSRVRQFIEMVNGTDSEVRCLGGRSPKSQDSYPGSPRTFSSPSHKASSSQPYLTGTLLLDSRSSELMEIPLGKETNPLELHQLQKYLMFGLCTKIFQLIFSTSCLCFYAAEGFDSNCCNGVTSNKSHSSSPHSHKPCPPSSGPALQGSDISLNGSRSQQPITRYREQSGKTGENPHESVHPNRDVCSLSLQVVYVLCLDFCWF